MAKGDDWLGGLLLLGGLWLLGQALSKKNVDYYRCWNCNRLLLPNTKRCPSCHVDIDWGSA